MKILLITIRNENLSTFIDLFVNHGKETSFPWLLANHFHFFGDFDNLSSLNTLLKFRRGFNNGMRSTVRKLYFSDANHILKINGEQLINCCGTFKKTKNFNDSMFAKECVSVIHNVGEVEMCNVIIEEENAFIDDTKVDDSNRRFEIFDDFKEIKSTFSIFFKKLIEFDRQIYKNLFDQDKINEIMKIKKEREGKILSLNKEIDNLNNDKKEYNMNSCIVFHEDSVLVSEIMKKRIKWISKICVFISIHLLHYSFVNEPLMELIRLRKNNVNIFSDDFKEQLNNIVDEYFNRKNEFKYKQFEEIQHICKKLCLHEQIDEYNLKLDELSDTRKKFAAMQKRGETPPHSVYKRMKKDCDDLLNEVSPLMSIYDETDKIFSEKEAFMKPKNLIGLMAILEGNDESFIFSEHLVRNTKTELSNKFINLSNILLEQMNEENMTKEVNELSLEINRIYHEEKTYIINEINKNLLPDKKRLISSYDKIKSRRKVLMINSAGKTIKVDDLCLNEIEKKQYVECLKYLKEHEKSYVINKKHLEMKMPLKPFNAHNKRIVFNENGLTFKDENDWNKKMFIMEKEEILGKLSRFEEHVKTFKEICGLSPYGIVIGSITYDNLETETKELGDEHIFHTRQAYENAPRKLIDYVSSNSFENTELSQNNLNYLRALRKYAPININEEGDRVIKEKNLKIEKIKNEISVISERGKEEKIYDIINNEDEDDVMAIHEARKTRFNTIDIHVGKKIEKHLKSSTINRNRADRLFRDLVKDKAIESKNYYEELEVEEAITDSNRIVDQLFTSEVSSYFCFDFKKYRKQQQLKNNLRKELNESEIVGKDKIFHFNKFCLENNSLSCKKYDVMGIISYVKLLLAMRILKLNVNSKIYTMFGLKRCQSNFLKSSLVKLANNMMNASQVGFESFSKFNEY